MCTTSGGGWPRGDGPPSIKSASVGQDKVTQSKPLDREAAAISPPRSAMPGRGEGWVRYRECGELPKLEGKKHQASSPLLRQFASNATRNATLFSCGRTCHGVRGGPVNRNNEQTCRATMKTRGHEAVGRRIWPSGG